MFSATQVRAWDAYTILNEPVRSVDLMERAAGACVAWLNDHILHKNYTNIFIFCGQGNNGGDGLAIARLLQIQGINTAVFILDGLKPSSDFTTNLKRLQQTDLPIKTIDGAEEFPIIEPGTLVIDAMFGSGLNRPLEGLPAILVQHINHFAKLVVSIDIPSGLSVDQILHGACIAAQYTLSFQTPKLAFLLPETGVYCGSWQVLDIGLHPAFAKHETAIHHMVEKSYIKALIKPRNKFSHKYNYGHALLLAGSESMWGAAIMSGKACLRSGVGLLSYFITEEKLQLLLQSTVPEAMCKLGDTLNGIMEKKHAIGAGPGWGSSALH